MPHFYTPDNKEFILRPMAGVNVTFALCHLVLGSTPPYSLYT